MADVLPEDQQQSANNLAAILAALFATNPPTFHDGSTDAIRKEVAGLAAGLSHEFQPTVAMPKDGRYGNVAPSHVDMNANIQHAYDFLAHHCNGHWTEAQAMGIVANLIHESGCNPHGKPGDGGQALGLCQWHADRRAEFEKHFHKPFADSTFDEQLAFIDYEMTEGQEQKAGRLLKECKDPRDSAAVVSTYYERPADKAGNAVARASTAAGLEGKLHNSDEGPAVAMTPEQRIKQFDVAIGDSIAVAAHLAGVPAINNSAIQGRSPQAVLDFIKGQPKGWLKGKRVLLSTGASNNPTQLALAQQQVDALLHDAGATSVTVVGVGPRSDLNGVNKELEKIMSGKRGVAFAGALPATGSDQIHAGDQEQRLAMVNGARSAMPADQTQTAETDPRVPTTKANSAHAQLKKIAPPDMPTTTVAANSERMPTNPNYHALTAETANPKTDDKVATAKPSVSSPTAA